MRKYDIFTGVSDLRVSEAVQSLTQQGRFELSFFIRR